MEAADRAREIIKNIRYMTIATAGHAGQPWNTPVYCAYDDHYNFYWASDQNGQHSKNIETNNKVFIVIYDSTVPEGKGVGVYIQASASMLTQEQDIRYAISLLDNRVQKQKNKDTRYKEFMGDFPRRLYKAEPEKAWMNADGEKDGHFVDIRVEVKLWEK